MSKQMERLFLEKKRENTKQFSRTNTKWTERNPKKHMSCVVETIHIEERKSL